MRNLSYTFALFSFFCTALFAAKNTTVVEPFDDEKWWGAATALGHHMPLGDNTKSFNLGKHHYSNQAAPLLISSKGRYVWSEKPFAFQMKDGRLVLVSEFEKLSAVKAGETLKDAYLAASKKHFAPDGKIPPEEFFTKPQFNTWIELVRNQNQPDICKYAKAIGENGFPCGVLMVDGGWDRYYGMLEFRTDRFPDAKALNRQIHDMGYKVIYWVGPFVAPAGGEFLDMEKSRVLLQDKTKKLIRGSKDWRRAAVIPWWSGFSATYDTTSPEASAHLEKRLRQLMEKYDIDGFKFDGGDVHHVTDPFVKFSTPDKTPSDYTQGWAELAYKFPYNELRASWKTGGKALVQRLLDKYYSWKDIKLIVPHMVNAGLIGSAYTCPDMIGGGDYVSFLNVDYSKMDQRLIVRFAQASALMPMMQFSLAPWRVLDKKHLDLCRAAANLHVKFGGYILELAKHSSQTGEPIVRAMEYEFPNQGFENVGDQFMLGGKYLVAPVVTPDDFREVKLPLGKWKDELGNVYEGGKTVKIDAPVERLPYFEKL